MHMGGTPKASIQLGHCLGWMELIASCGKLALLNLVEMASSQHVSTSNSVQMLGIFAGCQKTFD